MSEDLQFNVQPGPRVLAMLGEIKLEAWRCFGEILDNSVDEFVRARRDGAAIENPRIEIDMPVKDAEDAEFVIRDNGRGMDKDALQMATRAGLSGAAAMEDLGLFGMGFNVATASMGDTATVWTTRSGDPEWIGLTIDLQELIRNGNFDVKGKRRPKENPNDHGTEVRVGRIRSEFRKYLTSGAARGALRRELERAYASMLRPDGYPLPLSIEFQNKKLHGYRHCFWGGPQGDQERVVETAAHGPVNAYQEIDVTLTPRKVCGACFSHLASNDKSCTRCGRDDEIKEVKRRIHGWLGIQRYLSETDFGIDFVRMGRKIEVRNKELFSWTHEGKEDVEYPIDDYRGRGRIVGEIHIDHCRVSFTKDRFERSDPQWTEMVNLVRGEGPLRPIKAKELNYPPPSSPLAKLYAGFRRSIPGGGNAKKAGHWKRLLVIKDNEKALEFGQKFHDRVPDYQSDAKAYELIEDFERTLLQTPAGSTEEAPTDFAAKPARSAEDNTADASNQKAVVKDPPAVNSLLLSGDYQCPTSGVQWKIVGLETAGSHSRLQGTPWSLTRNPQGDWEFHFDPSHRLFKSVTLTPLDALLAELAHRATDARREHESPVDYGTVLVGLRQKYATASELDAKELAAQAQDVIERIAETVASNMPPGEGQELFDQLPSTVQDATLKRMAKQKVPNPNEVTENGTFLRFLDAEALQEFFRNNPELFFDGQCWADPFGALDDLYGQDRAEPAREAVVVRYDALFSDLAWLATADAVELREAERPIVIRAMQAVEIMAPEQPPDGPADD